jgi:hypothetical protein
MILLIIVNQKKSIAKVKNRNPNDINTGLLVKEYFLLLSGKRGRKLMVCAELIREAKERRVRT